MDNGRIKGPARQISRKTRAGVPEPGFIGPGHTAITVVSPDAIRQTDPFVLLMDDTLALEPGRQVGDEHPHAGLETVTLILEGSLDDAVEGLLDAGDLAWMTAGSGVIHNEQVRSTGRARILQLWVALPLQERRNPPQLQVIKRSTLAVREESGVQIRIYSGASGGVVSPTRTVMPMTIADIRLRQNVSVAQELPGSYRGLLYVLDGTLLVGEQALTSGDVGWLDPTSDTITHFELLSESDGARVLLYAGCPLEEPLLQHGPFVAGSREEFITYFEAYQADSFVRLSQLARD